LVGDPGAALLVPGRIGGERGVVNLHQGLAAHWDVSRTLMMQHRLRPALTRRPPPTGDQRGAQRAGHGRTRIVSTPIEASAPLRSQCRHCVMCWPSASGGRLEVMVGGAQPEADDDVGDAAEQCGDADPDD
jgi:hypothetical protein